MVNIKKFSYVILNIIMLVAVAFSLMIYTSLNPSVPWYESCGTQFLAIFLISDPIFIMIFIGFSTLKRKQYVFTNINFRMPIYILLALSIPLIIDGRMGPITISFGILVCGLSFIKIVYDIIKNLQINTNKL